MTRRFPTWLIALVFALGMLMILGAYTGRSLISLISGMLFSTTSLVLALRHRWLKEDASAPALPARYLLLAVFAALATAGVIMAVLMLRNGI